MNANPDQETLKDRFKQNYLHYLPDSHQSFLSPADLDVFLNARFDFLENKPDEIKLQVYNPPTEFFWLINSTILEIAIPDSRFIVDSLIDYISYRDLQINLLIHPILELSRNKSGKIEALGEGLIESYIYIEVHRLQKDQIKTIQNDLIKNLTELRGVARDYPNMLSELEHEPAMHPQQSNMAGWIKENFIMLGSERLVANSKKNSLGIFRDTANGKALNAEILQYLNEPGMVAGSSIAIETSIYSNVNRRKPYYVLAMIYENSTLLFAGHFANRAELMLRKLVPGVPAVINQLARDYRVPPDSFTYKQLYKIAQVIPIGLHFTRPTLISDWYRIALDHLYTDEPEYSLVRDPVYEMVWIAAMIPDRDVDQIPGARLQEVIQKNNLSIRHKVFAKLSRNHLFLMGLESNEISRDQLYKLLQKNQSQIFYSWSLEFRKIVHNRFVGQSEINQSLSRFFKGMSPEFKQYLTPEESLHDLEILESLINGRTLRVRCLPAKSEQNYLIKLFTDKPLRISDTIPLLSNFGIQIDSEYTLHYTGTGRDLYTLVFCFAHNTDLSALSLKHLAQTLQETFRNLSAPGRLDALVITANLMPRELKLVKAISAYYFQIDKSYSRTSQFDTLLQNPTIVRALIDLFHVRHNPDLNTKKDSDQIKIIEEQCSQLQTVLEESLIRNLVHTVLAIQRTNYYTNSSAIAFKVESPQLNFMPAPIPFREIFVYDHDMQGIHLRGGPVSRGGLRWSDRTDDFRTEILGLMKAQMVKNTVIVPEGSKGGFVITKRNWQNRTEQFECGKAIYRRYIECLLSLTDNRVGPKIQPPPNVQCLDQADPYLVVAADKGTATFSDLANEVSLERGFWLGDAFASGGARGYDHKKQGITARGTWEAIRRHFLELGLNPDKDPIQVVGIGDMGGDVFGNGMLISQSIKLVAAFNHRFIFIDPDPDPAISYAERKRLFISTGNWDAYKSKLISKGGAVFDRNARKIALSTQAGQILGIKKKTLSGEELIQSILRAPVDLLWNGGIGTYVKSTIENDFAAHDPANDRVRVNGKDLRARVIGEGGNLGITQAGRIEAAQIGVRLNTDAIDNSAGVDMSDHEVNLKILLEYLQNRKKILSFQERNRWISRLDANEIKLVLGHNRANNLGLSLDQRRTHDQFLYFRNIIKKLNQRGYLNREADSFPFEADLDRIEKAERTLARPILCSLMGFCKLMLQQDFLAKKAFEDKWYDRYVRRYFPDKLVKSFDKEISKHPLKREIIITEIVNDIVNNAGIAFFERMQVRSGKENIAIAETYMRLSEFLNLYEMRSALDRLPDHPVVLETRYRYCIDLEEKIFSITRRLLESPPDWHRVDAKASSRCQQWLTLASKYISNRNPRSLRTTMRHLNQSEQEILSNAYRSVAVIEDALLLFFEGPLDMSPQKVVPLYFHCLEHSKLPALRQLQHELQPESDWEARFHSRIDAQLNKITLALLAEAQKSETELSERVRAAVRQAGLLAKQGALNAAIMFEILQTLS